MNPFSYGTVVKEPYFFDRKSETERIVNVLSGGNNLVLYAPRRYGKTSLVMRALQQLEGMGFICIYFDFMTVYSRESFIKSFSKSILEKQNNVKQGLTAFSKFVKGIKPSISFNINGQPEFSIEFTEPVATDKTLDSIIDLPDKLSSVKKQYIIAMDEFQDISKLNGENFEDLLRSKIQHHESVNYLFLGSRTHILNDMFTNENRPFYNSADVMHLGPLPEQETISFLIDRFSRSNISISQKNAAVLIEKAGNIPYYIQFLASEVWQEAVNYRKEVSKDVVDLCADKILDRKNDFYFELFDRQTAYQKKLLKALAISGKNVLSNEYSLRFRLSAASTTQKALAGFVNNGIIEKHGHIYNFTDPFFKWFVLRLPA